MDIQTNRVLFDESLGDEHDYQEIEVLLRFKRVKFERDIFSAMTPTTFTVTSRSRTGSYILNRAPSG